MAFVNIESISMAYPGSNGTPVRVFENFSLNVEEGQFLAIVGPSGCGKTTLLDLIGDLLKPNEGNILINGASPSEARKQNYFSYTFQNPVLLPWRSVKDNICLAGEILKNDLPPSRVHELVELVGLVGFEDSRPSQLSGGMRARVELARALSFKPRVLLLDEPFGALDEMTRLEMNNLLMNVWERIKNSATCILVTHSIDEAIYLADRVIVLSHRPAQILHPSLEISLPRPRDAKTRISQEFVTFRHNVEKALLSNLRDKAKTAD